MAGYTRQDTANNIANGNVIDADDFDAEYNAIEAGFNASTGHAHDGTAGEGAPITKVGPAQDLIVSGTALTPKTTNTLDLGTASVQYKNAWFDGTVDTDALTVSANATVGGTLGVTGIITATGGVTGNVTGNVTGTVSDVSNHDTDDISEGSTNLYFTTTRARDSVSATGSISYNSGTGVISFTQGNTDTVAEGTTNLYYTDARATAAAKAAISVTDAGGDGSLTYSAGAITYTGPSAAETRAHFSGGTGVSITNGVVAIGQAVGTTSNVTFNDTVVNGNLTVNGTTTTVNTETLNLADNQIVLNSNETGTPTQNGGIEIERGTATNKTLVWNEADDKWTVGSETFVAGTFEGALTGNTSGTHTGNVTGDVTGNADTATALETSRTISLTGDVSGSVSFNGTANATITATVADDSHNHVLSNIDGITVSETEINRLDGVTSNVQTQITDLSSLITQGIPSGAVQAFAMSAAPTGWLKSDGSAVSRTTYADLFTAIGTTFGSGDGSTTFNLPDLRGEFVRGWDDGRGVDSGRSFGSAQSWAIENIVGTFTDIRVRLNNVFSATGAFTGSTGANSGDNGNGGAATANFDFDASRVVNTASETRPRNIALLYCIKT
jgi:microcystin-dependent protein